jgi:hypothetical protein
MRDKRSRPQQASLEEVLADPIVWTLMKSDRVEEQELRTRGSGISCGRRKDVSNESSSRALSRVSARRGNHAAQ